ncbi:uncharacterized protein K489DRAFT_326855 [Dissoconium aciculare CBS 342.82]|uniref:gamma-glutamylcyclotransferase n=1 Tax=Dissoconium aciculare CBS 342.82 TaxID=1314786 RepID=A0A6J3LT55_9PEZI|nr:uncharacterized protein K489DRAFT_326855 [Dissoconium aciculare CBS 342.82]KAF1818961.1 hypothetical protein K489DRAFT_326855 [Dissoconium aciculare CBS 342.82]
MNIRLCSTAAHLSTGSPTLYFGYGSNLWLEQMRKRCPTSEYIGIARLQGYKWIIYDRGYANIVKLNIDDQAADEHNYSHEVWGLVYSLQAADEKGLDGNEGVPIAYQKAYIECELWSISQPNGGGVSGSSSHPDTSRPPVKTDLLVYINHHLTHESAPKEEYIYRMNQGIHDALKEGVPTAYVQQVMRRFIPARDEADFQPDVLAKAHEQGSKFRDER